MLRSIWARTLVDDNYQSVQRHHGQMTTYLRQMRAKNLTLNRQTTTNRKLVYYIGLWTGSCWHHHRGIIVGIAHGITTRGTSRCCVACVWLLDGQVQRANGVWSILSKQLMTETSRRMIGHDFMAMYVRRFPQMLPNLAVNRWTYDCLLILTMLVSDWQDVLKLALCLMHGCPNDRQRSKHQCLVRSLSQWSTAWRLCVAFNTSYKMMGIPLTGPSFIYSDDMAVIHNTQRPESTLKKKSNQICYHAIRESVVMGESLTGHIPSKENPADLATKIMKGGEKRNHLVSMVLYDIFDWVKHPMIPMHEQFDGLLGFPGFATEWDKYDHWRCYEWTPHCDDDQDHYSMKLWALLGGTESILLCEVGLWRDLWDMFGDGKCRVQHQQKWL